MTITQEIISDGYRESMLTALGVQPDAAQTEEGFRLLSRIVASVYGNEVGEGLVDWPVGNETAYGGWTPSQWCWLQGDTRVIIATGQSYELNLPPNPQDGDRLQLIDAGSNFAQNPITLIRQAALFNGSTGNYVADTEGFNKVWMYRSDVADWRQVLPLVITDEFPFPERHDDAFVGMLATRLNPRYQQTLSAESRASLKRAMTQLSSAYSRIKPTPADLATLRLTGTWPYGYYGYPLGGGPASLGAFLAGNPYW